MLKTNEKKWIDRFWHNVKRNSHNEIISFKPGAVSKFIFPVYAGVIILALSIVWFVRHPEIVIANGVITGSNAAGNVVWAEVDLKESNIKKIVPGESVQLRFDEYPYARFGMVQGSLQKVTLMQNNKRISVQVILPNGLTTSKKKIIPFIKGEKLDLLIIVKDRRLLQHILSRSSKSIKL